MNDDGMLKGPEQPPPPDWLTLPSATGSVDLGEERSRGVVELSKSPQALRQPQPADVAEAQYHLHADKSQSNISDNSNGKCGTGTKQPKGSKSSSNRRRKKKK